MTSGFHPNELLYPLTKGDIMGHAFHGNQYSSGVSDHVKAGEKAEKRGDTHLRNGRWEQAQASHKEASQHFHNASKLERSNGGSKIDELAQRAKDNESKASLSRDVIGANQQN